MRRADLFEKTLMLGKIEGRRGRGWWRMRRLDGITIMDMGLGGLWELVGRPGGLRFMGSQCQTWLSNWTELNWTDLHIWSYWYFSQKSWFQLVIHPAQHFCIKVKKKQGENIHPCSIPFPIWNQSVVPCPVLTVDSWLAYRFLKRQIGGLVFPSL